MRKYLLTGLLVVGLVVGVRYFWMNGVGSTPIAYRTAMIEKGSILASVGATGTINPVTSVQIGAQVTGKIISLHADFNSVVKAGDIIARIDPSLFQTKRDQAAANLINTKAMWSKARADLAQRKRELDRTRQLFSRDLVSQNELDVAMTAYEGAEAQREVAAAQIKQAQALLDTANLDLKYTVIRSPVDGIVIARNVEVGQTVTSGFTTPDLFLIALDLTKMQVDANVSEADIGGIREGQEATFSVDAYPNVVFHGLVRQIRNAPIIVQNVVTYDVVLEVDNADMRLKPGMTANVSITVAHQDEVLMVPNAAFRFSPEKAGGQKVQGKPPKGESSLGQSSRPHSGSGKIGQAAEKTVWKMSAGGDPVAVAIRSGITDGQVTEIREGDLHPGDTVIVGIISPQEGRKGGKLPPGFGPSQQRTSPREKGI